MRLQASVYMSGVSLPSWRGVLLCFPVGVIRLWFNEGRHTPPGLNLYERCFPLFPTHQNPEVSRPAATTLSVAFPSLPGTPKPKAGGHHT